MGAKANPREWGFHTAKVNCVAWSPNSQYVASGGLDCSLILWSVEKPEKHKIQTSAHSQSQLNSVVWLDNQSIATCGQDGNVNLGCGFEVKNDNLVCALRQYVFQVDLLLLQNYLLPK